MNGRLLVSTDDAGYVVVRRNLREFSDISVDAVRDCDGGRTIDYVQLDGVSLPPRPDDLLSVEPNHWFGYDFSLYIYDDERFKNVPAPACVEVDLGVHLVAAAPGTEHHRVTVRAQLERPDGGNDAGAAAGDAGEPERPATP